MYAILEFDQMGLKDIDFRRVDYDVQKNSNWQKTSIFLIIKCIMKVWSMAFIIPTIMSYFVRLSREGHDREIDAWLEDFFDSVTIDITTKLV